MFVQTSPVPGLEWSRQTVVPMSEHRSRRHAVPVPEQFGFERFAAITCQMRQPHYAATEAEQGDERGAYHPQGG